MELKISPYLFLLFEEWVNNVSWFADVWLECDGGQMNSVQIATLQGALLEMEKQLMEKERCLFSIREKASQIKTDLGNSLSLETQTASKICVLRLAEYHAGNVGELLHCLGSKIR